MPRKRLFSHRGPYRWRTIQVTFPDWPSKNWKHDDIPYQYKEMTIDSYGIIWDGCVASSPHGYTLVWKDHSFRSYDLVKS